MKKNNQKHNWIVDVLLFACFLLMFFLDFTGLSLHQWLGMFAGAIVVYHLFTHWQWVKSVTSRFFERTSLKVRLFYLLDAGLLSGFMVILVSGLLISSWLKLPLGNAHAWAEVHVQASNITLMAIVVKIGLHWRWIVNVARQKFSFPQLQHLALQEKQPAYATVDISRRDFLSLMGVVSLAALVVVSRTLSGEENSLANDAVAEAEQASEQTNQVTAVQNNEIVESLAEAQPTPAVTVEEAQTRQLTEQPVAESQAQVSENGAGSSACFVDCQKGCSYPGRCHRYIDSNNNNRCDHSECVS
jgi:hypothetical protein